MHFLGIMIEKKIPSFSNNFFTQYSKIIPTAYKDYDWHQYTRHNFKYNLAINLEDISSLTETSNL